MENKYKSLGGWMLFWFVYFCLTVVLVVNALLEALGVSELVDYLSYALNNSTIKIVFYARLAMSACVLVLFIWIIVLMLKKTKKALEKIKLALIIGTIMDIVSTVAFVSYLGSVSDRNLFDSEQMINIVGTIVMVAIILTYFNSSKRVAVYFDENYVESIETIEVNID